jgi:hypothetical protein
VTNLASVGFSWFNEKNFQIKIPIDEEFQNDFYLKPYVVVDATVN